jgi:hypothetical protein
VFHRFRDARSRVARKDTAMKKKIALLSFGVLGLLVVLTLLAFSANASHNTAAPVLAQPAQVNTSAPPSDLTLKTNASDEADFAIMNSSGADASCGHEASSAGY